MIGAFPFEAIPAGYIPLIVQDTLEGAGQSDSIARGPMTHPTSWCPMVLRGLWQPVMSCCVCWQSQRRGAAAGAVAHAGARHGRVPDRRLCAMPGRVRRICDRGIAVSDFCLRSFFGPGRQGGSFTGSVRDVLVPGASGALTWLADDGLLYQARADYQSGIRVHGGFSPANRARLLMRELVDRLTPDRLDRLANSVRTKPLLEAEQNARRVGWPTRTGSARTLRGASDMLRRTSTSRMLRRGGWCAGLRSMAQAGRGRASNRSAPTSRRRFAQYPDRLGSCCGARGRRCRS